jgi:DNA repair exonuclease SbcCD ATPase subunit
VRGDSGVSPDDVDANGGAAPDATIVARLREELRDAHNENAHLREELTALEEGWASRSGDASAVTEMEDAHAHEMIAMRAAFERELETAKEAGIDRERDTAQAVTDAMQHMLEESEAKNRELEEELQRATEKEEARLEALESEMRERLRAAERIGALSASGSGDSARAAAERRATLLELTLEEFEKETIEAMSDIESRLSLAVDAVDQSNVALAEKEQKMAEQLREVAEKLTHAQSAHSIEVNRGVELLERIASLESARDELESRLSDEAQRRKSERQEYEQNATASTAQIERLEASYREAQSTLDSSESVVQTLRDDLERARDEARTAAAAVEELESRVDELAEAVRSAELAGDEALRSAIESHSQERVALEAKISALEGVVEETLLNSVGASIEDVEAMKADFEATLSKQEAKIQNLEKLAAIGREMMAVKDTIVAECAALQNEIVECEAQKDALSLENAKLLGRLAALEQD